MSPTLGIQAGPVPSLHPEPSEDREREERRQAVLQFIPHRQRPDHNLTTEQRVVIVIVIVSAAPEDGTALARSPFALMEHPPQKWLAAFLLPIW